MQISGELIGDYRLKKEISAGALTSTWLAEQVSIRREVILEILKKSTAADSGIKAGFLADIRAKATVVHPIIGAVYESFDEDSLTFYVREHLTGKTIEDLYDEGKRYTARELVTLLEQIGSAQRHLEKRRLATVPMAATHIFIEERSVRLVNLVSDGRRNEAQAARDKALLGNMAREMLLPSHPGATRVGSLLDYMSDLDREIPLTWRQVRDLSRQVIDQFDELEHRGFSQTQSVEETRKPLLPVWAWTILGGVAAIALILGVLLAMEKSKPAGPVPPLVDLSPISISEGKALAIHEVTITEYAEFLDSLKLLSLQNRNAFDHPSQPTDKKNHLPDEWESLRVAAGKGGLWKARLVNSGCPIVGIDWWDAYAYCSWVSTDELYARLPTMKEWVAASGQTTSISGWGKASAPEKDRTKLGFIGMAGNVREWTRDLEVNPSAPLQPKKPVACGGSFREPASGVKALSWLDSKSARADDLGFRVFFEEMEED